MPDRGTSQEEYPRIEVELAPFCLDLRETTLAEYRACVARGACTPPSEKGRFCNARLAGREQHPVNCVTWDQAQAYCQAAGRRLPDELEWEYAARGGQEYRRYPWGSEHPDGRTCWKHPGGSCAVGSYPAGAFGLFDVSGNVWEWTRDRFGPYPFPPPDGTVRSYRGGSWSRRFEKWMRPGLRNRDRQSAQGSHLGFRCALTPPGVSCPAGADPEGGCLRAVLGAECEPGFSWNGARCSRRGAAGCPSGMSERRGYGCVPDHVVSGPLPPGEERPVTSARTPAFDGDCAAHYPGRPAAYRWEGGTHATRNHRSRARGCANRDVGTGWNSTCCP